MAVLVVAVISWSAPAAATHLRPELEKVPIERLLKNLEAALTKSPFDANLHYGLARANAMAYADVSESTTIVAAKPLRGVWFGLLPRHVPFGPVDEGSGERRHARRDHLRKAIGYYKSGIRAAGKDASLTHWLGLAWCVEQFGDTVGAISLYRRIFSRAWKTEQRKLRFGLRQRPVAAEAAMYLVALLDPNEDAQEIVALRARADKLQRVPRAVTPIVVPLTDSAVSLAELVDPSAAVPFDLDGSGLRRPWGWTRPKTAGWLVFIPPGADGRVTSGLQLFGAVTFWMFWPTGYHALGALDDDGDGELRGDELRGLAIWADQDRDGVSQPHEVRTMAELGIVALSSEYQVAGDGTPFSPQGLVLRSGATRPTYDWTAPSR